MCHLCRVNFSTIIFFFYKENHKRYGGLETGFKFSRDFGDFIPAFSLYFKRLF